jgi:hypothetical protein
MMADLFQTTIPNISMRIKSIFDDGELLPGATVKDFLTVRQEGAREMKQLESDFDRAVKQLTKTDKEVKNNK